MRTFTLVKHLFSLTVLFFLFSFNNSEAQILDPNDPIVEFNPNNPPAIPPNGVLRKWVRTKNTNWNTDKWKAYYLSGVPFRLRWPENYDPNRADKYPVLVILHGLGYSDGSIYDNDKHLSNSGGNGYEPAIESGEFESFVLSPQSTFGWFGPTQFNIIENILNLMNDQLHIDLNRISVNGRSGGAEKTWSFINEKPSLFAAALPMSGTNIIFLENVEQYKYTRIWQFQGELDPSPTPQKTENTLAGFIAAGGNARYTMYLNSGHSIFNKGYAEPDLFDFLEGVYLNDPVVLNGNYINTVENSNKVEYEFIPQNEFCQGDPVLATLGVPGGFNGYEWRKDGAVIQGATGNELTVSEYGTYDVRFRRGSEWTDWSPHPVVVQEKPPTNTPDIQLEFLSSVIIPAPDGSNSVKLILPDGYTEYSWFEQGSGTVLSAAKRFEATQPGNYVASVVEPFGCSSNLSNPFTIVDANGTNKPDQPINLTGFAPSKTGIQLVWSQNPSPTYNETGFEVYRSETQGGPYDFIALTDSDEDGYLDENLLSDKEYYYLVRAVNSFAASEVTNELVVKTQVDTQPPTAPLNLSVSSSSSFSVALSWDASNDDVGVYRYDVYRNGVKILIVENTSTTVYNLDANEIHTFQIKARDITGNESPFSNQVVVSTALNPLAELRFENNLDDNSGNGTVSYLRNGPFFQTTIVKEGTYALGFDNSNDYVDFADNKSYIHNEFNSRTVAFWVYANSTNGIQDLFDEGGSTNGFGLRINNGNIELAVQDNQTIRSISSPFIAGQWKHVAGTFINGTIMLYVDGVLVNTQSGVPFNTVSAHSDESGIGGTNGSNAFDVVSNNFEGFIDHFYIFSEALSSAQVNDLINGNIVDIPDIVPDIPSDFNANALSYDQIELSWNDNSNDETGFQIYRAIDPSGPYYPIDIVEPDTEYYLDDGLDPETTYFYQLIALGQYGQSDPVSAIAPIHILEFENNVNDESGNDVITQLVNGPVFDNSRIKVGSYSMSFPGGNDFLNLDNGNQYIHTAFNQRSVALWVFTDDLTGIQDIYDEGGSTNGIGLRINNGNIEAGVQNQQDIRLISAPFEANTWKFVAFVFNNGSFQLFVDGILEDELTNIPYGTVESHGNQGGLGGTNSSNAFDVVNNNFDGWVDDFIVFDVALNETDVINIMNNTLPNPIATTLPLPPAPAAPTNLIAQAISDTEIQLDWEDSSDDELSFEIYRSTNDNLNFTLLETLPVNESSTVMYLDDELFTNVEYFYKVAAVNAGGGTESNESSAKTLNNAPELDPISNLVIRFDVPFGFPIEAYDPDPENLTLTVENLPAFGSFTDFGDGTAYLLLEPAQTDIGFYDNVIFRANDENGGMDEITISIEVNGNYLPEIEPVNDVSIVEGESTIVQVSASDQNSPSIELTLLNLPSFVSFVDNTDGTGTITINPGLTDSGTYNLILQADDGEGGISTEAFVLNVLEEKTEYTVYVNFNANSPEGQPWNNLSTTPSIGYTLSNLLDDENEATGFNLTLQTAWGPQFGGTGTSGMTSGIYPYNVMRSYYFVSDNSTQLILLSNLNDNLLYNLSFFASRDGDGNRITYYKVNDDIVSLNASYNTTEIVEINDIQPVNGEILIEIYKDAGATYGYINALVINSYYDDGNPPAVPTDISAFFNSTTGDVEISWIDRAFNEKSYDIYRSTEIDGTYDLLNPGDQNANTESYVDNTVLGNATYFYKLQATNQHGSSEFSEIVQVTVPNIAPTLANIDDQLVQIDNTLQIPLNATDEPGDVMTFSMNPLLAFASLVDNGDGTGYIELTPTADDIGVYEDVEISVADNNGGVDSQLITITVEPSNIAMVYINFTGTATYTQTVPWNNYIGNGAAGNQLNNLQNDAGVNSGLGIQFLNSWDGSNNLGMNTGDNSGVYPDNVIRTSIWVGSTATKNILVSGLDPNYIYDFTFFGSRDGTGDRTTEYSINGETVSLDAAFNTQNTVSIIGVLPSISGDLTIAVNKSASASYGYLNALAIKYYPGEGLPQEPSDLSAFGASTSEIELNWRDNSNSEILHEIYRSLSSSSGYSLIATTGTDVTTYTDNSLEPNTVYYYKVRAQLAGDEFTDYSNVANASTIKFEVSINLNVDNPAAAPWNNTNSVPDPGYTLTNLMDNSFNPTGINMENVPENPDYLIDFFGFSGDNPWGMITGDNSGAVPDNVMRSTWWMDQGRTAQLRFYGLDLSLKYNFKFFASREGDGNRTTEYIINDESVALNASYNTSEIVQLNNAAPDDNGEIIVTVRPTPSALYGYLGGIIIQAFRSGDTAGARLADNAIKYDFELGNQVLVYPNPFTNEITINLNSFSDKIENISITDLNGRLIYFNDHKELKNLGSSLNLASSEIASLTNGVYLLEVKGLSRKEVFKIIKE